MTENLEITTIEDQERVNTLLTELGTIIARNNRVGLELDFDHWAETVFGRVTGYNFKAQVKEEKIEIDRVWYE